MGFYSNELSIRSGIARGPMGSRWSRTLGVAAAAMLALSACSDINKFDLQDRDAGKSKDQFNKVFEPGPAPADSASEPPIPSFAPVVQKLPSGDRRLSQLVTIEMDSTTPLKDLLAELGRQAGVDLELDPNIEGKIIFTAKNRPFADVIDRIADLAALRYSYNKGVLRVEQDTPYYKTYRVDYLNMVRTSTNSIGAELQVASVGGSGGGGGGGKNSASTSSTMGSDFWKDLEDNIAGIMANTARPSTLVDRFGSDLPALPPGRLPPPPEPAAEPAASAAAPGGAGGGAAGAPGAAGVGGPAALGAAALAAQAPGQAPTANNALALADQALNNPDATGPNGGGVGLSRGGAASTLPADKEARDKAKKEEAQANQGQKVLPYTLNKQAGLVSVYGTQRQHRQIGEYLDRLAKTVTNQVLIEARVFEVRLSDQFSAGINWRSLLRGDFNFGAPLGQITAEPPFTSPTGANPATAGSATLGILGSDLAVVANLIGRFGTVRTLSSPRLTALHNQTATLKVAENQVYFKLTFQTTQGTANTPTQTNVTSEIQSVPVGVIITVTPMINTDSNRIDLNIRPVVSRIARFVSDPGALIQSNGRVENLIPVISTQEFDSIVSMQSGEVIVMGGLMQNVVQNDQTAVPGLGDIPLLGNAFKGRTESNAKTELVIFLKATILNAAGGSVKPEDKDLYRDFGRDPRPIM